MSISYSVELPESVRRAGRAIPPSSRSARATRPSSTTHRRRDGRPPRQRPSARATRSSAWSARAAWVASTRRATRASAQALRDQDAAPRVRAPAEVVARFQREAEAAASIQSPNVVDVYDVHKTPDGGPYIVGEFLEGNEFARLPRRTQGRIDVATAVRIVRQVLPALSAAHEKGIVHRDMKPENVFLTGDTTAPDRREGHRLRHLEGRARPGTDLTKTGMIMGTPSYMAPEQARGDKVDAAPTSTPSARSSTTRSPARSRSKRTIPHRRSRSCSPKSPIVRAR